MSTRNKLLWAIGILAVAGGALAYGVPVYYVFIGGILLLCPAMMFMHGHGGRNETGKDGKDASSGMPSEPDKRSTKQ